MLKLFFALAVLGPTLVTAGAQPSLSAPRLGTGGKIKCEVVSVGQWYCTAPDGKGYYCDSPNPDLSKNCRAAMTKGARSGTQYPLTAGRLRF